MKAQLPRVVLDHELLVEIERHLVAGWRRHDGSAEIGRIDGQPLGRLVRAERLLGDLERLTSTMRLADLDLVARLELVRRDVGRPAVDGEVTVGHEVTSLRARSGDAHPVDHVVQPQLQRAEEVLAGHARTVLRIDEVVAELAFEDPVGPADLLLLAKLETVLADLAAADAVLAGRRRAPLERALLGIAAAALEEELCAFPAAEAADGSGVTGHGSSGSRRDAASAGGSRCAG